MARIPLVVSVECDAEGCEFGIIVHSRGDGIGLSRLEEHLEQEGWLKEENSKTSLQDDICPACARRREVQEERNNGQLDQEGARADH